MSGGNEWQPLQDEWDDVVSVSLDDLVAECDLLGAGSGTSAALYADEVVRTFSVARVGDLAVAVDVDDNGHVVWASKPWPGAADSERAS